MVRGWSRSLPRYGSDSGNGRHGGGVKLQLVDRKKTEDGAPSKKELTATNTTELFPEDAGNLLLIPMYTPFLLWRERERTEHPLTIIQCSWKFYHFCRMHSYVEKYYESTCGNVCHHAQHTTHNNRGALREGSFVPPRQRDA